MATKNDRLLRVMVDSNILVAGTGWPRFPYEVLQHAIRGDFQLVLTEYAIDEARTHIVDLVPEMLVRFERLLEISNYEVVEAPTQAEIDAHADFIRDPKDIPVALAAINAQVDCLVTQDKDLTDERNAALHQRLRIMLPGTFLHEHMGWTSEALEVIRHRSWRDFSD